MANKRKYRWDQWFSRPRFSLTKWVEYDCSTTTMIQAVRNRASERGLSIKVVEQLDGGGFTVIVAGRRGDERGGRQKAGAGV